MYEYIKGRLAEAGPAFAVVECGGGLAYRINISLNTYTRIRQLSEVCLFLHLAVRDDAHLLYGFFSVEERNIFRQLISVSGVGAATAMLMLSSMNTDEIVNAIMQDNVHVIKQVKGIGMKTAQKIIIELRDKVGLPESAGSCIPQADSGVREEALSALVMLGFSKSASVKAVDKILGEGEKHTVESLIKCALKHL